jgi:two-component system chemotaxis sensor kinase CheA
MADEIDEILQEFLVESYENLDRLDGDLVALEQDPGSRNRLSSIFRTMHTIKGTAGFLALPRLEELTHCGESLLSALRDGEARLDAPMTSVLLQLVDAVRVHLKSIERSGVESDSDDSGLVRTIEALQQGGVVSTEAPDEPEGSTEPAEEMTAPPPTTPEPDAPTEVPESSATDRGSVADGSIRVDVELLDRLMTLVGELVLSRNQIVSATQRDQDAGLSRAVQRLNQVTTGLQQDVMRTRMQPVDTLFSKFPRVVRGLAVSCGKSVRISFTGREIELDRTLLEAIRDPLTHLLRNAVDHGLELPEERQSAGKPPEGQLVLRAQHRGGQVVLELSDDGKGIDPTIVGQKAVDKGLISAERLAAMSDRERTALIFRPGFSTTDAVTNVSGRGVGMDVVKTNIERIGGIVEVVSEPGHGTTIRVTIPLTLAIIPALTVTTGGEQYAIPQLNIRELVRLGGNRSHKIEYLQGVPVYRLREKLLPIVDLAVELQVPDDARQDPTTLIVLRAAEQEFGLLVDDVQEMEEIVVKPLSSQLAAITIFAGATIVTDGRVALILDVLSLALGARAISHRQLVADAEIEPERVTEARRSTTLLLVGVGENRRIGLPLDRVTRLEELPRDTLQQVGGRQVARYRGQILPLVRISSLLGELVPPHEERLLTVVHAAGGRSVGLVVDEILDIASTGVDVNSDVTDAGLTGSVLVDHRVVELLDFENAVAAADPYFYAATQGR